MTTPSTPTAPKKEHLLLKLKKLKMTNPNEIWLPIPGFETQYEVSNLGSVRGWYYGGKKRRIPKIKKPQINKNGYLIVVLQSGNKIKATSIHRLVLSTFDKQMPKNIDCCHKNHNKLDNRLSNLEWGTRKYNELQKAISGRKALGEKNGASKLTSDQVLKIRSLFKMGNRVKEISNMMGVKQQNVSAIINRKSWRHI